VVEGAYPGLQPLAPGQLGDRHWSPRCNSGAYRPVYGFLSGTCPGAGCLPPHRLFDPQRRQGCIQSQDGCTVAKLHRVHSKCLNWKIGGQVRRGCHVVTGRRIWRYGGTGLLASVSAGLVLQFCTLCAEIFLVVWLAKTVQDKPSPRRGSLEGLGKFLWNCVGCKFASCRLQVAVRLHLVFALLRCGRHSIRWIAHEEQNCGEEKLWWGRGVCLLNFRAVAGLSLTGRRARGQAGGLHWQSKFGRRSRNLNSALRWNFFVRLDKLGPRCPADKPVQPVSSSETRTTHNVEWISVLDANVQRPGPTCRPWSWRTGLHLCLARCYRMGFSLCNRHLGAENAIGRIQIETAAITLVSR